MIYFIKGRIYQVKQDSVIIESNNIGYEIFLNNRDIEELTKKKGEEIVIYTYLVHKEDAMTLFGFLNEKNKNGFLELLKVDGIGPKLALKVLSFYQIDTLFEYIQKEDITSLKKIPGVGPKMAGKIIFDLKGIIPQFEEKSLTSIEKDLIDSITNLGYDEYVVMEKLKVIKPLSDNFETEFKKILKLLSKK